MKKQIALLLAGVMAFSATACGVGVEELTEVSTELNIYISELTTTGLLLVLTMLTSNSFTPKVLHLFRLKIIKLFTLTVF